MSKEFENVIEFNEKIIGLEPTAYLNDERLKWFKGVINEELDEFTVANKKYQDAGRKSTSSGIDVTVVPSDEMLDAKAEMADAIIDLLYFAYGRLFEVGITSSEFDLMWDEVQKANMAKVKGNKGRGSDLDAVKPEGWKAPEKNFKLGASTDNCLNYQNCEECPMCSYEMEASMIRAINEDKPVYGPVQPEPLGQEWTVELMNAMPKAFIEATKLCMKKSQDYNNGQNKPASRKDYFPFGLLSYAQMLHTKTQRLNSLAQQHGKTPNNESVRDTLIDLINYANFAIEAIDKGEI